MQASTNTSVNPLFPRGKIYTERHVQVASGLGGPLVGAYLISRNFNEFQQSRKAWAVWGISIVITIFIFYSLIFSPYAERIPNFLLPLVFAGIGYFVVRVFQADNIEYHLSNGGETYGWFRTICVSLIGTVVTLAIVFGVLFALIDEPITKQYGVSGHEVSYYEIAISSSEVDSLAESIIKHGFLENEEKWYLFANKDGSRYIVSFSVMESSFDDAEFLKWIKGVRNGVQSEFPDNKIVFNLITGDLDNVRMTIEESNPDVIKIENPK